MVVSLLNKGRRACLGVECQIVGDAVAYYRNRLLKWNTNCLAEAYMLSYKLIFGSLPLAKNAKHSPSISTLGAHAQKGYGTCLVCVSVYLSVCLSVCYHSSANIALFYAQNKVRRGLS